MMMRVVILIRGAMKVALCRDWNRCAGILEDLRGISGRVEGEGML